MSGNGRKGPLFSMLCEIGLCVGLEIFFFKVNGIAGFDGLNLFSLLS
jgi:hypothetical protein